MAETAEKASIGLFLSTFETRLAEKRVGEAKEWFGIIAAQLKFPDSSDIYKEMKKVEANPNLAKTEGVEIVNAFTAKIIDKIVEEVDEALVAADPKNKDKDMDEAQVKAVEGIGFYLAGQDKIIDEAWTGFTRVESQVRGIDASSYVKIEKLFGETKDNPEVGAISQLNDLFGDISAVKSGQKKAARASATEVIFTTFERAQPILFTLLALLGVYPIYLISRAFGWRNKAWRNIGIFIILLIVPVFMEALGRLGVEMKIDALQALSFTVSEWAKMAWTVIVLAAFLFAINGLRAFCAQFGIKAFGVRQEPEEPIQVDDTTVEVL